MMTLSTVQPPPFADEAGLTQLQKAQLFLDWDYFMRAGFEAQAFTPELYRFFIHYCRFIAHTSRHIFWQTYFDDKLSAFRSFLRQFGGDRVCAEYPDMTWLEAPGQDLKLAMCRRAAQVYGPLSTMLNDLEENHQQMGLIWADFAQQNQIQSAPIAPAYRLGPNSRQLLSYCISIALECQLPPPPLQQMMPFFAPSLEAEQSPTLFQEVLV
ncbi:MAG: hypothetical protein AAF485_09240 [Chloroflexota bacterium]